MVDHVCWTTIHARIMSTTINCVLSISNHAIFGKMGRPLAGIEEFLGAATRTRQLRYAVPAGYL